LAQAKSRNENFNKSRITADQIFQLQLRAFLDQSNKAVDACSFILHITVEQTALNKLNHHCALVYEVDYCG